MDKGTESICRKIGKSIKFRYLNTAQYVQEYQ